MTLEEVGATLRRERERKGYSVDVVASRLKIGVKIIRSLEEADAASLPHAAYVRGFVRAYGSFLGFSPDDVEAFVKTVPADNAAIAGGIATLEAPQERGRRGSVLGMIALLLALAGGLFLWIHRDAALFSGGTLERLTTAIPLPARNKGGDAPEVAPDAARTQSAARQNADQPDTPDSAGGKTGTAAVVGPPPREAPRPASAELSPGRSGAEHNIVPGQQQTAASLDEAARRAAAAVNDGQHKIIITAFAECWIHSSADGTDTRQFSLHKGDTFALTFGHRLELKLGNAGGVRLRYNGQDMPEAGKDGQIKTLVFPPAAP